jgi:hypothetical protein
VSQPDYSLAQLRAEAAHAHARLSLYRARVLTGRASTASKLRELERVASGADGRLRRAELAAAERSAPAAVPGERRAAPKLHSP